MSNYLVTGAAGLVGYNACKFLSEQGHYVLGIDNLERSKLLGHTVSDKRTYFNWDALLKLPNVAREYIDVSDTNAMNNLPKGWCDGIIHLAGQCGVPTSIANPRRDFEINTLGTFNVLEYARAEREKGRGTKVAFASTNKVYNLHSGWTLEGERWRWSANSWHHNGFPSSGMLSSLCNGSRTPYGNSKFMADAMMQEWYHMYGVPTGCFRMSCIYGPNQFGFEEQGWATWFLIAALKDLPITIYGDGKQVRDMLYVGDLVKAYYAFLTSNVQHGVWNTGGGVLNTLSLNECLDFLRGYTGKPIPVEFKDWRPSDQKVYTSDISNLKVDLNWRPTIAPIPGLQITMDWVKENLDAF